MDRTEVPPLHRHRDRDDDLAAIVDPHHAALQAVQGVGDLDIALAILGAEFAVKRQVAAIEPGPDCDHCALGKSGLFAGRGRQVEAHDVAAAIEAAAVEDQRAVAIVNPSPRRGRRNQLAQHRRNPLRVDRKVDA